MRSAALVVLLLTGCHSDDDTAGRPDGAVAPPDARSDALEPCVLPTPEPPPACLALEPAELRGTTPFGALALELDYVGAGDCITISAATLRFAGACGESLHVQFSYPVTTTPAGRAVTVSFETEARLSFRAPGVPAADTVARVRVDVDAWHESDPAHVIDISLAILDDRFAIGPVAVRGTFCDWPYHLC